MPIADVLDWVTVHDNVTGWLRVAPRKSVDDDQLVLIATDTILGIRGHRLNSVWLRPRFETESVEEFVGQVDTVGLSDGPPRNSCRDPAAVRLPRPAPRDSECPDDQGFVASHPPMEKALSRRGDQSSTSPTAGRGTPSIPARGHNLVPLAFSATPGVPTAGSLIFSIRDYSFDFEVRPGEDGGASFHDRPLARLLIGTLQLEVEAATGIVLFARGRHPHTSWVRGRVRPENQAPGVVTIHSEDAVSTGMPVRIARVGEWVSVYDASSGWLRVAPSRRVDDDQLIHIAAGTLLGISDDWLTSVWLHPEFRAE